jgi:hypothetical protein
MVWLKITISAKINNRKGGGMKFDISFQEVDKQALVSFVKLTQKRTFCFNHIEKCKWQYSFTSREDIWLTMAMCLFTTQQRSGPKSLLVDFYSLSLFRFPWKSVQG